MKRCPKCGETKPCEEFAKNKGSRDGLRSRCKACDNTQQRAHYETIHKPTTQQYKRQNPLKTLWDGARHRAKKYGVAFTLPHWKEGVVETHCPYCLKAFTDGVGTGHRQLPQSRTLDRVIPNVGYTPENTRQICAECNSTKNAFDVRTNTVGLVAWAMAVEADQRAVLALLKLV